MKIRGEQPGDIPAIRELLVEAFEQPAEADLVERLRDGEGVFVSLVAELSSEPVGPAKPVRPAVVVGHILFTEVTVRPSSGGLALGLAPMAVVTAHQRQGIGSRLIETGLANCRELQASLVVVLGHPNYYPRFGFARADTLGLEYKDPVPPEAFMALPLDPTAASRFSGTVHYRPEFDSF